jgi:ammonium transporter, Amt family
MDTAASLMASTMAAWLVVPGLALLHGGMVRAGSVNSVLLYHLGAVALVTVLWVCVGYSMVFSTEAMVEGHMGLAAIVGSLSKAFMANVTAENILGTVSEPLRVRSQLTLCCHAAHGTCQISSEHTCHECFTLL